MSSITRYIVIVNIQSFLVLVFVMFVSSGSRPVILLVFLKSYVLVNWPSMAALISQFRLKLRLDSIPETRIEPASFSKPLYNCSIDIHVIVPPLQTTVKLLLAIRRRRDRPQNRLDP
uniref:Secreted protein n=1 Tax=Panagrellus redivivus TaxID=6233 RepID=A0A7E4VR05_PANRE